MWLPSDVTVGIVDKIHIEGVHMLLRNNFVGGQVDMCFVLYEKSLIGETCTMSADEPELDPKCVVTIAKAKNAQAKVLNVEFYEMTLIQ